MDYKPDSLSGGQKQRSRDLARGLAHDPRIVLADEPTAALDEESGRIVVDLFKELARERGVTILMVTHDNRVLNAADRIVNMVGGQITSDVVVGESALICEFLQRLPVFKEMSPPHVGYHRADTMRRRGSSHPATSSCVKANSTTRFYLMSPAEMSKPRRRTRTGSEAKPR